MNRTFSKLASLALVLVMLMTTAMPLLSSNVSGGPASEGSATLASVGPDGKPYKDPADYTVVPVFNIDFSDAISQGINEIQYLTEKTLNYRNDPLYGITGDGSPEDPFVVKNLWFEGSPAKWQGRFVWQGVLYNWVFINCVFESQVSLNANRNLQASGSTPIAISFEDCTFYSVPAGVEVSQSGAGLSMSNNYWGNPLGTATFTFKNNTIINIDPFTGITGATAMGLQMPSSSTFATATIEGNFIDGGITTGVNTRVIVQNNTLLLNSAKPGAYSGQLYLNGCGNGTIISNNSVASIQPIVSAAGVTVRIYDNIVNGEGKKAQGIYLSSSTPNNLGKNFYVYNNAISNTTSEGIYGNLNGGGTIHVYSNFFENTTRGFRDNYPLKTVIERFDSNTFVNAWSADPVIDLTYERVVKAETGIPVSWTYDPFIESSEFSAVSISANGGTDWVPTYANFNTTVDLGAEERWYNFLLSVTDTEDNEFIESIDIARDLSPPVVTFLAPLEGKTLRTNTLRVFYETTDLSSVAKARIKLDNGAWIERADNNFNGFTFTAAQGASRGAHTLTLYVEDIVGNGQEYSVSFVFRPMGEGTVIAQGSIVLDGDDDLSNYARFAGLAGEGTSEKPYVLKGLNLDCGGGVGITVKNTAKHLEIYDIEFFNGLAGVRLENAANVEVKECIFHDGLGTGVLVIDGTKVTVTDSYFDTHTGVYINSCLSAGVRDNIFVSGTGVEVEISSGLLNIAGNSFESVDAGAIVATRGTVLSIVQLVDNHFDGAVTAMDLDLGMTILTITGNEISRSDLGIDLDSTAGSTIVMTNNVLSHCGEPLLYTTTPMVFSGNQFVLNENSDMLCFTSPADGYLTGGMTVECEYSNASLGSVFNLFEASNDMVSWKTAGANSHIFNLGKEGVNTLYLRGTDSNGNIVIISKTVVRDTTPPTVSIVLPQSDLVLKANYLPFRWTASDVSGISSVMVKLGNGDWITPDTMSNHTFSVLGLSGPQTLYVNVTDNLGHSTVVTASFVVVHDDRPSGPVVINGNDSLRQNATLLGWTGDGSEDHPFKVGMFHPSLSISNTDLYVDICDMSGVGNITLVNVKHVAIRNIEMAYRTTVNVNGFEDLIIENNNLTKMGYLALGAIDGVQTYSSLTISNGKDLILTNNEFTFTWWGTGFMAGYFNLMTVRWVDNANISDNTLSTTSTAVSYMIRGVVFQGTNSIIEGNTMTLLRNGGIAASGTNLNISNNNIIKCSSDPYYFGVAAKRISPAISASGEGIIVFNNVVKESTGSMPSNGGPGIRASGSVNVSSNTIATFRLGMLINDGAVAWNNVITDCRVGMSGNGVMRHNTVSAMYGVAPTAGAMIEGNDIDVTEFGIYCEFYYIIDLATSGTVTDLANDVTMTNNNFKAKVGVNIDDKVPADTDIISGLKLKGNTFDCTEAAIRIVGASLTGAEISGNTFNGAGFALVNIGSSTFGVDFRNNVFTGVAADSLISFVKPSGAVTPLTIVALKFNGSLFGLSAMDQGCRLSVDGSEWFTMSNDGLLLLDASIPDGTRTLSGELRDNKGNTFVASMNIVFDSEAPIIEITSPSSGGISPLNEVTVKWSVQDDGTGNLDWVRIKIDDGAFRDLDITGTGNYEWTFLSLADGTHTVTIEAMDDKGHVSTVTRTFIIDASAPTVTIDSPSTGSAFASGSVLIKFTAADLGSGVEKVEVRIDGGEWTAAVGSEHLLTGLGEGSHTIAVRATDFAKRTSTATITVVIDATAPTLTIESPTTNAVLDDGDVSIVFDAGDATRIEARVNNGVWATISNEAYDILSLTDGIYTVSLRAYDAVGNMNETSITFVIDTVAPSVSISSPTDGATILATDLTVHFSAEDSNGIQSLILNVDGTDFDVKGRTSYSLSGLSDGTHVIVLTATDAAGNVASKEISFVVDTTAPSLTITSPTSGTLDDGDVSIVFNVGDATRIEARVNNGAWTSIPNEAYALSLSDGTHTVALRAYDAAGNMNETSVSFVVDTTAPKVSLINPAVGTTVDKADLDVSFTVTDASAIRTLTLSVDGTVVNVTDVRVYRLTGLSDGTHALVFKAVDALGNEASYTFEIIVSVPVTVSGRIVDGDGNPLVGAKVSIGSASAITDANGRYSLVTVRGESTMTVTADGMNEMKQTVDLANEQASVTMSMKSLSGSDSGSTVLIIGAVAIVLIGAVLAFMLLRKKGKL